MSQVCWPTFAASIYIGGRRKLFDVLATHTGPARIASCAYFREKSSEIARLQNEISAEVNDKISKHQRDFFF